MTCDAVERKKIEAIVQNVKSAMQGLGVEWKQAYGYVTTNGNDLYSVFPFHFPDTVIQVSIPGAKPSGMSLEDEFDFLRALQVMKSDHFAFPEAIAKDPDWTYIRFTGEPLAAGQPLERRERKSVGHAIGEFCGRVFVQFGAVHTALFPHNLTRTADGRTGIENIPAIKRARHIETAFLAPLCKPDFGIFPYMAAEIAEITGQEIKEGVLLNVVKNYLDGGLQSTAGMRAVHSINSNLGPWLHKVYNPKTRAYIPG